MGAKDGHVGIGPHGDVLLKAAGSLLRRWGFDTLLARCFRSRRSAKILVLLKVQPTVKTSLTY